MRRVACAPRITNVISRSSEAPTFLMMPFSGAGGKKGFSPFIDPSYRQLCGLPRNNIFPARRAELFRGGLTWNLISYAASPADDAGEHRDSDCETVKSKEAKR
jgi:hypothetical protein